MKIRILSLVLGVLALIGIIFALGPGLGLLIAAAIVPFLVASLVVRHEHLHQTRHCLEQYVQIRRHMR